MTWFKVKFVVGSGGKIQQNDYLCKKLLNDKAMAAAAVGATQREYIHTSG